MDRSTDSPVRVLHVLGYDEDVGGILSVIRSITAASDPRRFEHAVWVHQRFRERRSPALRYVRSRFSCGENVSLPYVALGSWELWRLLRRQRFDLLHAHSRCGLIESYAVSVTRRVPVVFSNHAFARRVRLYRHISRAHHMHTVLLNSRMAAYYGVPIQPPKTSIISACCDDRFFRIKLPLRPDAAAAPGPIQLVGIGTLVERKRWHLLIEALAGLEGDVRARLTVDIWGEAPDSGAGAGYRTELLEAVAQAKLQSSVRLRGPAIDVAPILTAADWFVLPSADEPCSVALIEALALGVPAIAADSGGSPEIVGDNASGFIFKTDDATDLRRILRGVATGAQPSLRPYQVRETVRSRSAAAVAAEYSALYDAVLEQRRG